MKPKGVSADRVSALKTFAYSEWPMAVKAAQPIPVGVASTSAVTMDEDLPAFARKGIEKEERCAICLQVSCAEAFDESGLTWTSSHRTTRTMKSACSVTAITASTPTASRPG